MNTFAPCAAVRQVTTDDGAVLLDMKRGRLYGLNPTGGAIWQALAHGQSVEQITRELAAGTGAPSERIRADIETLITQLRDHGLLTPSRLS